MKLDDKFVILISSWVQIAKGSTQAEKISVLPRKDAFLSSWGGIFNFLWSIWVHSCFSCSVSYLTFGVLARYLQPADVHLISPPHRSASSSSFVVYRLSSSLTCHTLLSRVLSFSLSHNCSVLIVSCLSFCPNFSRLILLPCVFESKPLCPLSFHSKVSVYGQFLFFIFEQKLKRAWNTCKDTIKYDLSLPSVGFLSNTSLILLFKQNILIHRACKIFL